MTYEEKITFCKLHLGEDVQFSDVDTWTHCCTEKLGGIRSDGLFISSSGIEWKFCRLIPKPQFIDWTCETAEPVQLRRKCNGAKVWMNYDRDTAWFESIEYTEEIPYPTLREEWETVDGRPCGTEVKDD